MTAACEEYRNYSRVGNLCKSMRNWCSSVDFLSNNTDDAAC